jgi:hypothetical protein
LNKYAPEKTENRGTQEEEEDDDERVATATHRTKNQ